MTKAYVIDFETFYHSRDKYSLRNMGNEEYILDKRFQVHGCAVHDGQRGVFVPEAEFRFWAKGVDWSNTVFIGHNLRFDAAIAKWRYGIDAGQYIDTLSIANVMVFPYLGKAGLDACNEFLNLPRKTMALKQVDGLRTEQIIAAGLWRQFADYAIGDLNGPRELLRQYLKYFSPIELQLIDWTVRNYVNPALVLEPPILEAVAAEVNVKRNQLLQELGMPLDNGSRTTFRSRPQLAALLAREGVPVGMKEGKNGETFAFAKDDEFMQGLLNSANPRLQLIGKARLALQSSLEETRANRLGEMAKATGGWMLIPLKYHGARTGRFSGADNINVQNFGKKSLLRRAIRAPRGKALVCVDASQIECRFLAWYAGCTTITVAFREGRDLYSEFASRAFGYPVNGNDHPDQRHVGKVSILQLGYQSGARKLQSKLLSSGIDVSIVEADHYKRQYREEYSEIPDFWKNVEQHLREAIITGKDQHGPGGLLFHPRGIKLPSGRWILYRDLRLDDEGVPIYYAPMWKNWKQLYGGAVTENIVQATARDATAEVMCRFLPDVKVMTHDDVVQVVDQRLADERLAQTIEAMSTPPLWAYDAKLGWPALKAEGYVSDCLSRPN